MGEEGGGGGGVVEKLKKQSMCRGDIELKKTREEKQKNMMGSLSHKLLAYLGIYNINTPDQRQILA